MAVTENKSFVALRARRRMPAAHGTLLVIDLASRSVISAHVVPNLSRPTGLAIKSRRYYIIGHDGSLTVASLP